MKFQLYETNLDNVTSPFEYLYNFDSQEDADRYCDELREQHEGYFYSAECIDKKCMNTYLITHTFRGLVGIVKANEQLIVDEILVIYQSFDGINLLINKKIPVNDKNIKVWKLIE